MKCQYCGNPAYLVRFGDPAYPYEFRNYGPGAVTHKDRMCAQLA